MKTRVLLLHALFTALVTVVTLSITIPLIGVDGYFNLGGVVIFSFAVISGRFEFFIGAGIGSAIADLMTAWAFYAPFTLIIKAIMYIIVYLLYKYINHNLLKMTVPFIVGAIWLSLGYGVVEVILKGQAMFWPALIQNSLQGFVEAAITILIMPMIAMIKRHLPKLT
jgi:uncharacterized membrane protein